jgi:hypothetical protein
VVLGLNRLHRATCTITLAVLLLCALGSAATAACNDWQPGFEPRGFDGAVRALARAGSTIYAGGSVYAGGIFGTAGEVSANNVARWDGTSWSALGTGVDVPFPHSGVRALALDSSANLYAGGDFPVAGGVAVNGLGRWNGTIWSAVAGMQAAA